MVKRKRDYKAEYRRRIKRAELLGISKSVARGHAKKGETPLSKRPKLPKLVDVVAKQVVKDAQRVFGEVPQRTKDEPFPIDYEFKLEGMKERDGRFEWTDEKSFIGAMQALGLTEREAYTMWFSPE